MSEAQFNADFLRQEASVSPSQN